MRPAAIVPLAVLASAASAQRSSTDPVTVRVVDENGAPLPGAVAWTLPESVFARLQWLPWQFVVWVDNPHELLRRVGDRCVADAAGRLSITRGAVVAGEHGARAGVLAVPVDAAASLELRLTPERWVVEVRDGAGAPVPGVPIGASTTANVLEHRLALGLTDANGRLVVRAPKAVDVTRYRNRAAASAPTPPAVLRFEVDGMYLAEHAALLRLTDPVPAVVELRLPPVVRVEVRAPEWHGPLSDRVQLTYAGKGFEPDDAACWWEGGKWFALVAGHARSPTVFRAEIAHTTIGREVLVPSGVRDDPFPIEIGLDDDDIVVRGRLHDRAGRPVGPALLEVTDRIDALRTWWPHADAAGRFALVLRPGLAAGTRFELRVDGSRDPAHLGATTTLTLPELDSGDRRDVGILIVTPP